MAAGRLEKITAAPHPFGNRIDLSWKNPDPAQYPGVRVVRREGSHPVSPEDGVIVADATGETSAVDTGLKAETVYYYTLFPYKGDPPEYSIDVRNRTAAAATGPYDFAVQMHELLPAIYHRYDKIEPKDIPEGMTEEDKHLGQLRRFLDLPGGKLDQSYSFAKAALDLYHLDRVDGRLLPLLSEWIGWKTDFNLEIDAQRNEIRNAPAIYKTIEIIPTVEATVKRISGWESRTKEFVHNVFSSNRPERLNLWQRRRDNGGSWSDPQMLSLNFAYEGRPASVRDQDNTVWLFYHTRKKGQWNIWYKTSQDGASWSPSQPLVDRKGIDKHPTAVLQGATLWVFWDSYDETNGKWRIECRTRTGGSWTDVDGGEAFAGTANERKKPCAVADNAGGVWLFWLEKTGKRWEMKYNRHDGSHWAGVMTFPADSTNDPRVEADPFVAFHPSDAHPLRVFWARQEPTGEPGQTRWAIVYRSKGNGNLDETGWSGVQAFSAMPPLHHDREPAAFVTADGNIELFWSSNRGGSWSLWRCTLDVVADSWGSAEQITEGPYSQHDPLPVPMNDGITLIYRSNESIPYTSDVYGATETVDFRYAGCTTSDTRNAAKIGLRESFDDFQTYTYDAGAGGERTDQDWYGRDTIGLYLSSDIMQPEAIDAGITRVKKVLKEFMPATDRAVFIPRTDVQSEHVYTYGQPPGPGSRFMNEAHQDVLTSVAEEVVPGPGEDG